MTDTVMCYVVGATQIPLSPSPNTLMSIFGFWLNEACTLEQYVYVLPLISGGLGGGKRPLVCMCVL